MVNMRFDYPDKTRDDFLSEVVSLLKDKRLELGISQQELNARLGMADFLLTKWENGIRTPLSYHLYCWADALDCKLTIVDKTTPEHFFEVKKVINDNLLSIDRNTKYSK
ncbi:hypothetical protein MHTCC0001_09530 [Flavobacteriaceae bacterium MHTCC 0001]